MKKYKKLLFPVLSAVAVFGLPFVTFFYTQFFALGNGEWAVLRWIAANPSVFFINYLILISFLAILCTVLDSIPAGSVIFTILSVVVIFADVLKTKLQNAPLLPWDLGELGEALWAMQFMYGNLIFALAILGIGLVVFGLCTFLVFHIRKRISHPRGRAALVIRMLAFSFSTFFILAVSSFWLSPVNEIITKSSKGVMLWDQVQTAKNNGLYLSFMLNRQYMVINKASGYSQDSIKLLNKKLNVTEPAQKPTVIVVMSESFWDITKVPGLTFTEDPLPTLHSLEKAGQAFYMSSSQVGGGTCNVEFEALTGLSNAFLPAGSMPYVEYIKNKTPSLPWYFKEFGYKTTAMHPYLKTFWNRDKVYPQLGFDQFLNMEDMQSDERKGSFISDKSLSQEIIKQYEKDGPQQFIFAVSMQNHFPYYQNLYPSYSIDVSGSDMTPDLRSILRCYIEGTHDADAGLQYLIDYFSKVKTPVNIVFFGDHYPPLSGFSNSRLDDSTVPSFVDRTSSMFESVKTHYTPVAFWSNYGATIPDCAGKEYSALSYSILDFAGMPQNSYFSIIKEGFTALPVLQQNLVITHDGKITKKDVWDAAASGKNSSDVPKDLLPVYNWLKIINYDALFGKKYIFDSLWKN